MDDLSYEIAALGPWVLELERAIEDLEQIVSSDGYIMTVVCPYYEMSIQCLVWEDGKSWWYFPGSDSHPVGADLESLSDELKTEQLIVTNVSDSWN